MTDRAYNTVIYLVSFIWGLSMLLSMVPQAEHEPPASLHGVFMAIVGGAFALRSRHDGKRADEDDPKPDGAHRR